MYLELIIWIIYYKSKPYKSGYQDSNLGPPAPKAGALTGLRYTPLCRYEDAKMKLKNPYLRLRCKGRVLF